MNSTSEGQSFDIRLTSDQLRRDAQVAISQFNKLSQDAIRQGRRIDAQFANTGNALGNSFKQGVSSAKSALADLGKNIVGISALMASGTFIKDIYSSVSQFNKEMKIVSTISEDVSNNLQKYKDQVLGLCSQIAIAPETAAQALYQINSAGHLGADGMKVLEASAKAAVGGVTETAVAADAITTILNAYKMKSEDAEAVSDKLFTTVRLGKTTMDELGRSIAYVAPLAATYKISIDEVLAAVAQLTKQGNSTQNAMTQISASIQAVANELGDDAFKDGLLPALEEIEKRSNGSNMALKAQLSNIRALRGALGLTKENAAETAEMIDQIKNSGGAAGDAFEKMNSIAGAELTKLKNNFIKEFSEMATSGVSLMGDLAKALNSAFDSGHMQEFLRVLGMIIAAYGVNKAILMGMSAIENSTKISMLNAEYAALQQILPAKQANANADIEAAIAAGTLTEAKGMEIIALREELAQMVANATQNKRLMAQELELANMTLFKAKAAETAAAEILAAKRAELTASGEICGAYMSENAVKEINVATSQLEAATANRVAAAKAVETAQTRMTTASEELEVLMRKQNTVAQATETASTGVLAAAKRVLTAVTAKLNAVIAANPYTLAAAAVIALGVAIYKLCTYESQEVKQRKAVDAAVASTTKEYGAEMNALDDLSRKLKEAKKGSEEWVKAKQEVINRFGKYDSTLAAEIDRVGNLTTRYDQLTNAIRMSMAARAMERYQQDNNPDGTIDSYLTELNKTLEGTMYRSDGSSWTVSGPLKQQIQREMAQYVASGGKTPLSPKIKDYLINTTMGNTKTEIGSLATALNGYNMLNSLNKAAVAQTSYNRGLDDVAARYGFDAETARKIREGQVNNLATTPNATQTDSKGNIVPNKAFLEKQRDEWQAALDAMSHAELSSAKALELKKKIAEANAQIEDFNVKGKKGGKGGSGKTLGERQSETQQAQQEQQDLLNKQARDRARAEQDAQFQIEQAVIDAMQDGAEKKRRQRELDYAKEKDALQREMEDAILTEVEYQKAVFDAQEEVNEKQAAEKGKKYAKRVFNPGGLMGTHDAEGNPTLNADKLFEQSTLGNVDTSAINGILERYRQLFQSMEKVHEDTWRQVQVDAMNEYLAQWGQGLEKRNALIAIADRAMAQAETEGEQMSIAAQLRKDLSDLDIEANKKTSAITLLFDDLSEKSIADLEKLYQQGKKTLDFLKGGNWDVGTGEELGITEETFNTLQRSPEEIERIEKALKSLQKQLDDTKSGFSLVSQGLKELFKTGGDAKKFQDALSKITTGMGQITNAASFVANSIGAMGEALGNDTMKDIAEGLSVATDALDSAMQGAQAGAAFGPIGAAAGAALGIVSSLVSSLSKLHDQKYEKKINTLQDKIDELEEQYDRLGNAVSKAYSSDAAKLIREQETLLKQQQLLIQQQILAEKSKKNSDDSRIKDWERELRDIDEELKQLEEDAKDAIFGEDIQSAIDNFASAYESMFDGGINKARASKEVVKSMIKNMIVEAMKMDISEPMEKLREMMFGFWADGYISQWEQEQLEKYAEGIMGDLEQKYSWADDYFNNDERTGTSKGIATASQDSVDENNARLTTIQGHTYTISQAINDTLKPTTMAIESQLRGVLAQNTQMETAMEEMRGMSLIAIDHLTAIREHTSHLVEMNSRIGDIDTKTKRVMDAVEQIQTNGLRLK